MGIGIGTTKNDPIPNPWLKGLLVRIDFFLISSYYFQYKSISFQNNPLDNKQGWLGQSDDELLGFAWNDGADRHTTGVIMWSDIFLHDIEKPGKEKEKIAIVLFDTQGLCDMKTSPADNARIFALSTLTRRCKSSISTM